MSGSDDDDVSLHDSDMEDDVDDTEDEKVENDTEDEKEDSSRPLEDTKTETKEKEEKHGVEEGDEESDHETNLTTEEKENRKAEEISSKYVDALKKRLESDGIDPTKFSAALKESGGKVAGSYILQCITDKKWQDSDIDVWFPWGSSKEKFAAQMLQMGYGFPEKLRMDDQFNGAEDYARLKSTISSIFKMEKYGSPTIQLIKTIGNVAEEVFLSFDLSICREFFDGEHIYALKNAMSDIAGKVIRITDESAKEQSLWEWIRTLRRIIKYYKRGYVNVVSESFTPVFENFLTNLAKFQISKTTSISLPRGEESLFFINKWNNDLKKEIKEVDIEGVPKFFFLRLPEKRILPVPGKPLLVPLELSFGPINNSYLRQKIFVYENDIHFFREVMRDPLPDSMDYTLKKNLDYKETTCAWTAMGSDEEIKDYLKDNVKNIIIYTKTMGSKTIKAYCFNISNLQRLYEEDLSLHCSVGHRSTNDCESMILYNSYGSYHPYYVYRVRTLIGRIKNARRGSEEMRQEYLKTLKKFYDTFKPWKKMNKEELDSAPEEKDLRRKHNKILDHVKDTLEDGDDSWTQMHNVLDDFKEYRFKETTIPLEGLDADSNLSYECKDHRMNSIDITSPYFRINLDVPFYVPLDQVGEMIRANLSNPKVNNEFLISPMIDKSGKQKHILLSATHGAKIAVTGERGDHVSADHCQDGTDKYIYQVSLLVDEMPKIERKVDLEEKQTSKYTPSVSSGRDGLNTTNQTLSSTAAGTAAAPARTETEESGGSRREDGRLTLDSLLSGVGGARSNRGRVVRSSADVNSRLFE